ncbi:MAG: zinc-dependent alcohol dehydrogenase family protein [Dokdonella sp.]
MKKAQYNLRGPVARDVIEAVDFELNAVPAADHVRVEVLAAPINPSDVLTLTGQYGILPPLPAVGGNEGVGRVVAHGAGVTTPPIGQTVLLPLGCGTWITHLDVLSTTLVTLPNEADPMQLAMLTVNPPTASLLLSEFVDLQAGDWVIQNAANSAVGGYLIDLARLRGLKTVNIVRRESALADLRGGDVQLVDGADLGDRVRAATGNARIRLGIDAVGGAATDHLAACLANAAQLVNYGAMSGEPCHLSPPALIFRGITLRGFWVSNWLKQADRERRTRLFAELAAAIASGALAANVQATYPLERIKDAVAAAAAGERGGKIIVLPNG